MTLIRHDRTAFGRPGSAPNWTGGAKDGVGTARNSVSRVWFTLSRGMVTELFYPTIDQPQVRHLELLISDGENFVQSESRHLFTETRTITPHSLSYRVINSDPEGRYVINKTVIADPSSPCILQKVETSGASEWLSRLKLFVQCAPHLAGGGWNNNAMVVESAGRTLLAAEKDGTWLVLGANVPFIKVSCGYSGVSDGWSDLAEDHRLDWEFNSATDGNVVLTAELPVDKPGGFTLGLAFGDSLQHAITNLFHSLALPFEERLSLYDTQWSSYYRTLRSLEKYSTDGGTLAQASVALLASHEDKTYPGAFIASMSIPWGESRTADNGGAGYHLVWTRDMVNTVTGLLAAGDSEPARRALVYLSAAQGSEGNFPQNFWLDGRPHWQGVQLDEVAFPVLLAWKMHRARTPVGIDTYPLITRAAAFLIDYGPATEQERWEENSGYSPSTLASNIAALICAASFCREYGDATTGAFIEDYADFLEAHLEQWTVTEQGRLAEGITRHYIRINPVAVDGIHDDDTPGDKTIYLQNQEPGTHAEFPARDIVDAGFLELVRYGIRAADDPLIRDSLEVIDAVLKVDTPFGQVWRRYNHDGYGQRTDGGDYQGWGRGGGWPLLTGERAHYELAAGGDINQYLTAMEGFSSYTGLLPEQVWDRDDLPEAGMYQGRPTDAAMPLMWAHAEYIKLLRSRADGQVFDRIPEVADRYLKKNRQRTEHEVWKPNYRPSYIRAGTRLRVITPGSFQLVWTMDDWSTVNKTQATATGIGLYYVDLATAPKQRQPVIFTFFWTGEDRWEGRNYEVKVKGAEE
jgi:glucoamylase